METIKIARMRTLDGLYKDIHTIDPLSQISRNFIRQLVITRKVKSVKAGNKYLVNLDEMLEYLANPPEVKEETEVIEYGKLRRIEA